MRGVGGVDGVGGCAVRVGAQVDRLGRARLDGVGLGEDGWGWGGTVRGVVSSS